MPLHLVCPHCQAINRVPSVRLNEAPDCGRCHRPLFSGHPVNLSAADFERHLSRSDIPLLVDFWAPWCGPCRMVSPVLEEINGEREDLRVVKLNVDENQQTAVKYEVLSIPTMIMFRDGQMVKKLIGAQPKARIEAELELPALA